MKIHFLHDWEPLDSQQGTRSLVRLNGEAREDIPMTTILYQCWCGKLKTKNIQGRWNLTPHNK